MVSLEESRGTSVFPSTAPRFTLSPSASRTHQWRLGRSMRTIRSNFSSSFSPPQHLPGSSVRFASENDSPAGSYNFLGLSEEDVSRELYRLASFPANDRRRDYPSRGAESQIFAEIVDNDSMEDLLPAIRTCINGLSSPSLASKRSSAEKLRMLAKNSPANRDLIGKSGAIPALVPLLHSSDPLTQEHAVTAILNLSLHEQNKPLIQAAGGIKALVQALETGSESSKQNAAYALVSLSLIDGNRKSIGLAGAMPPLVKLLLHGSNRGKKDALTALYKLCSEKGNKERAVVAGAARAVVESLVGEERESGLAEKAAVVLSSLAGIEEGRKEVVEGGGIQALVEELESGSEKGKELAAVALLQICGGSSSGDRVRYRAAVIAEGGIPPLVALSECGTPKAKHKADKLLGYLRGTRQEAAAAAAASAS